MSTGYLEREIIRGLVDAIHCAAYDDCKHKLSAVDTYNQRVQQIVEQIVQTAADQTRGES